MLNKMTRKIVTMLGTGAAIALFSFSAHSQNMLANANFDIGDASGGDFFGASGWDAFGSAYTTQNTLFANTPLNSLKAFGGGSGAGQTFAATAGDVFSGSAGGQNYSGDPLGAGSEMFLQVVFKNADGQFAGTEAGGNFALGFNVFNGNIIDSATPQDEWLVLGVGTAPAPDDTATVTFNVLVLASGGGSGFFDTASFEQVAEVPVPAAVWLFGSALMGLVGVSRRRAQVAVA